MTRGVLAVVLAAVLVLSPLVAPVAVADEHDTETDAGGNESTTPDAGEDDAGDGESNETEGEPLTTSEDPEVALEQSDFAAVHDIQFRDGYALVTIRTTQPVSVTYPTQGTGELDQNEAREVITTTERIPRGETTIRVEMANGDAFFTVDGATVVLSGENTIDRSLVAYLSANQALLVGAAIALAGAIVAGYRQKLRDDLDEPENAFRGGDNR